MPDFRLQPSFPIGDVINAASRNSQLQEQAREAGNQSLVQGMQAIGQVGQSLYDTKRRVAQSLALGRQFDIPDDVAKTMQPDQILQVGAVKKGQVDMNMLLNILHPGSGGTTPQVPTGASPVNQSQTSPNSGAMLTSDTTTTPISPAPLNPPSTGQTPVPIAAPPLKPQMVNSATMNAALKIANQTRPEHVMTQADALAAGAVPKGTRIVTPASTLAGSKEQDTLENQAINRLSGIRGDMAIRRIEEQRDASIQAFNTISQIKSENRMPSQIEYYDLLGQMWKARTGAAPTDQAIRDLDARTFKGDLGKATQYFTGQPAGRTTADILSNIQNFAKLSGLQSDKLHDGYMSTHQIKPSGLSDDRWKNIMQSQRGLSFKEATQQSNMPNMTAPTVDDHVAAIQWAQAHPNDPRSGAILQKAMQATQGAGGSVGL